MNLKNKKGLFFVGRPHHIRLWKPVLDRLENEGMEILYITAHTPYPFETSVIPHGITPIYIEDLANSKDLKLEEEFYRHLTKDIAEIHKREKVFNLFAPTLFSQKLRFIVREIILFNKFLEENKVDIVFALHELNRWSKLLAFLTFKKGIPFVTLQEGAYYFEKFSLSFHTEYSTANLVWGQQTVDLLTKLGNAPEKNVIVGDTHLDEVLPKYRGKGKYYKARVSEDLGLELSKPLVYLIQGSGNLPLEYVLQTMSYPKDLNFILKFHPSAVVSYVDEIRKKYERSNFKIVQNYDSYDLLCASDVCVTMGRSTLTFEAFAFDKPVVELNYDEDELYFSKFGIAPSAKPEELIDTVKEVLEKGIDEKTLKNRKKWLEYVFYKLDGRATDRVIDTIKFVLKEREYYKKKKWESVNLSNPRGKRFSFNIVFLRSAELISETVNRLLDFINPEIDEINIIFAEPFEKIYSQFKRGLNGKGVINFYLAKNIKLSMSSIFNFSLSCSKGDFIFLFKEGVVPLRLLNLDSLANEERFVGSVVITPDNKVKHLGVTFEHNNVIYRLYEGLNVEKVPIKEREFKAIDYVIGGKRELFEKTGKFDERIADYYSIIDYSLSAYYREIKNVVSDKLFFGLVTDLSFQPLTPLSHAQFYTKWRGKTEYDLLKYTEEDGVDIYELYKT